ncbi:MAG: tRNA 2-thiouridine(34) synthase MnmA, partial [Candidatus Omnitrophica bacterium]|nr:tRNA 2-thiouridine(34) synthase MnmA [Candidatus Omnitrophota bacterium]
MKILAAMSGGVDSAIAAALLLKEGHEVVGVTFRVLPRSGECTGRREGCCGIRH